jgi:uncharacterized protein (TIGR03435 family)
MRGFRGFCIVFLFSGAALGQAPVQFEVATIKPSAPQLSQVDIGVRIDGAQARYTGVSLKDLIASAYRMKLYQVVGPDWLASEKFDIAGKLPEGADRTTIPEMMQNLLVTRFHLSVRHEMKEFPVYAIEIGKGALQIKESSTESDSNDTRAVGVGVSASAGGVSMSLGRGASFTFGNNRFEGKKLTMPALADTLGRFLDRPVVDATNLTGTYDLVLDLSSEDYNGMMIRSAVSSGVVLPPQALRALDSFSGDSLTGSLQKLGLKFESRKTPLEVLVVDRIDKAPTEN